MGTTSIYPFFPATELDGGYIEAIEVGPRREMLEKTRRPSKEMVNPKSADNTQDDRSVRPQTEQKDASITVGAQMGDPQASNAVTPHFMALKHSLNQICTGPYSAEVAEFALVLRVDGDIWHWDREGCDRMRRSKKERYITIDIYVPRKRWEGILGLEIRRYLAACVEEALQKMIGKLHRDKVPIDADALLSDLAQAKEHFLSHIEAGGSSERR